MKGINRKVVIFGLIACMQVTPVVYAMETVKKAVEVTSEVNGVVAGLTEAGKNAWKLGKRFFDTLMPNISSTSGKTKAVVGGMAFGGLAGFGLSYLPVVRWGGKTGAVISTVVGTVAGGALVYAYIRTQEKLDGVAQEVTQVHQEVTQVHSEVTSIAAQVDQVKTSVTAVQQEIGIKTQELEVAMKNHITEQIAKLQQEIASLKLQQQELKDQLAKLTDDMNRNFAEILSRLPKK